MFPSKAAGRRHDVLNFLVGSLNKLIGALERYSTSDLLFGSRMLTVCTAIVSRTSFSVFVCLLKQMFLTPSDT